MRLFTFKTATLALEWLVCMVSSPHLWFCVCKTETLGPSLYWSQTSPVALCMQNSVISNRNTTLYGFPPSSVVFGCKKRLLDKNNKSQWVPDLACDFVHAKSAPNTSLNGFQVSSVFFCMQNNDFWTRITSLCGSQTSPVVLCLLNRVISTRNTSLYGSQPSSVVFARKTASLWPELQVSMGPRPHLLFCVCKTAWLAPE